MHHPRGGLIELSEGLLKECVTVTDAIYRIISFFELYRIASKNRLRFTKAALFADRNEAVGKILQLQEDEFFRGCYINPSYIKKAHKTFLENAFVSCWTREPDMIAIWALYSSDLRGVRIKTSKKKLEEAISSYKAETQWGRFKPEELNSDMQVTVDTFLGDVEYVDFTKLRDQIRQKYKEFEKQYSEKFNALSGQIPNEEFEWDYREHVANKILDAKKNGLLLKDRAYMHEHEVRAVVQVARMGPASWEKYVKAPSPQRFFMAPYESASQNTLDPAIFLDVPDDFIEEVCVDPRCPAHVVEVYKDILSPFGLNFALSEAFGSFVERGELGSTLDGDPL